MKKILVPLDGSTLSERALPYAASLAERTGARLLLIQAVQAGSPVRKGVAVAEMAAIGEAEADLAFAARRLRASGLEVEARAPYGPAAAAILDEAAFGGVDMVVMSTHGRSGLGRWIYGSVADEVLRRAELPVLLVPPGAPGGWGARGHRRVVVALDGSGLAEASLEPAIALAVALGAGLVLLSVVEPLSYGYFYAHRYGPFPDVDAGTALAATGAYLDRVAAGLRDQVRCVDTRVEIGPPAATIAAVAHELGASAIVLATHGRGGLTRVVQGSVATGLLPRADAPVLLVRPAAIGRAVALSVPTIAGVLAGAGLSS